jgi:hypothetical protein
MKQRSPRLDVQCPRCDARPGEPCYSVKPGLLYPHRSKGFHKERRPDTQERP